MREKCSFLRTFEQVSYNPYGKIYQYVSQNSLSQANSESAQVLTCDPFSLILVGLVVGRADGFAHASIAPTDSADGCPHVQRQYYSVRYNSVQYFMNNY